MAGLARYCALLIASVLVGGCAGQLQGTETDRELPSRLYVDANLGISVEIPQNWARSVITPLWRSPAPYAVAWQGEPAEQFSHVSVQLTILDREPAPPGEKSLLQLYRQRYPNFTTSALRTGEASSARGVEILGYTPLDNRRLLLLELPQRWVLLECIAPADRFERLQPIFDEVLASLHAVD